MRLSKIVTRTGDGGETGLATGRRLPKTALRIEALGEVDELNAHLGWLGALTLPEDIAVLLRTIQHHLFDMGAELALDNQDPTQSRLTKTHLAILEEAIVCYNATLPPLREFILPGGNEAAARAHLARTVCRRVERRLWALCREEALVPILPQYVNRLSDLLFILARVLARQNGGTEIYWQATKE